MISNPPFIPIRSNKNKDIHKYEVTYSYMTGLGEQQETTYVHIDLNQGDKMGQIYEMIDLCCSFDYKILYIKEI